MSQSIETTKKFCQNILRVIGATRPGLRPVVRPDRALTNSAMSITSLIDQIKTYEETYERSHRGGTFGSQALRRIFEKIGTSFKNTMETGCGKSTILFSNFSERHLVFAYDDQREERSSVRYFRNCQASVPKKASFIFGPTQKTLPRHNFRSELDVVLLDGPHAYPFPDLEYFFVYPHIKAGGYLILDDIQIPSIARMADILAEDRMYRVADVIDDKVLILQRTNAPTLDPYQDFWTKQNYNLRRIYVAPNLLLKDGLKRQSFLKPDPAG